MPLSLDNLKPGQKSNSKRTRRGRGNASGKGNYSGKGMKGQKARSGTSGLQRIGIKNLLRQTPKIRGFKSHKEKAQVVNLRDLNNKFNDGEEINPEILIEKGLVNDKKAPIKILGEGELKVKKLKIVGVTASRGAQEQIEKQEGKIETINK